MSEQPNLEQDETLRYFVLLAERFNELAATPFMCEVDDLDRSLRPSPTEVKATLLLAGLAAAQAKNAPNDEWDPPVSLMHAILDLLDADFPRHAAVDPPQLLAAYFLGWHPRRVLLPDLRCEPGRLLVKSIIYKFVHSGLHHLAEVGVAPLTTERCNRPVEFAGRIAEATDEISLELMRHQSSGRRSALAKWNCERSLWQVVGTLVVGPGPTGKRPQAGAYRATLLGDWADHTLGVIVGTVVRYACPDCGTLRPAACLDCRGGAPLIAARRHQFLTPATRLAGDDVRFGYEQVRFKRCRNADCERKLKMLTGIRGLWPIYREEEEGAGCPRCQSRTNRTVTVWARQS